MRFHHEFDIPLRAVPKGRARYAGHHYTPTETREFEEAFRGHLLRLYREPPMTGRLGITIVCHGGRGDIDNLCKAILDAAQADKRTGWEGLFKNDSQIDHLEITRYRGYRAGSSIELRIAGLDE